MVFVHTIIREEWYGIGEVEGEWWSRWRWWAKKQVPALFRLWSSEIRGEMQLIKGDHLHVHPSTVLRRAVQERMEKNWGECEMVGHARTRMLKVLQDMGRFVCGPRKGVGVA